MRTERQSRRPALIQRTPRQRAGSNVLAVGRRRSRSPARLNIPPTPAIAPPIRRRLQKPPRFPAATSESGSLHHPSRLAAAFTACAPNRSSTSVHFCQATSTSTSTREATSVPVVGVETREPYGPVDVGNEITLDAQTTHYLVRLTIDAQGSGNPTSAAYDILRAIVSKW